MLSSLICLVWFCTQKILLGYSIWDPDWEAISLTPSHIFIFSPTPPLYFWNHSHVYTFQESALSYIATKSVTLLHFCLLHREILTVLCKFHCFQTHAFESLTRFKKYSNCWGAFSSLCMCYKFDRIFRMMFSQPSLHSKRQSHIVSNFTIS